jgi:hypothetical protein
MGRSQFREVARSVCKCLGRHRRNQRPFLPERAKRRQTSRFNEFAIAYVLNPLKLQLRARSGRCAATPERPLLVVRQELCTAQGLLPT